MHINERSTNHNSGQDRVPQSSRISSNAEIALPHRTTHLYLLTLFFVFSCFVSMCWIVEFQETKDSQERMWTQLFLMWDVVCEMVKCYY